MLRAYNSKQCLIPAQGLATLDLGDLTPSLTLYRHIDTLGARCYADQIALVPDRDYQI